MLSTWKTAPRWPPAARWCLKPAEWSPLACSLLADLTAEAGLPPGVFNLVQGIGEVAGAALVAHPGLRRVSFTGSPEAGRLIGESARAQPRAVHRGAGRKEPVRGVRRRRPGCRARKAAGQYDDSGQVCLAGTRILVEESVRDEFLERFRAAADEHVLGDPREEQTTISPMIHPLHVDRVAGFVERARADGHEILYGGKRLEGLFFEPT
jgi:betaine-aldehyde dehydrogenase/5-carboxymethyl-2-hydroxymuconic-semialdehyde dehydrogenase